MKIVRKIFLISVLVVATCFTGCKSTGGSGRKPTTTAGAEPSYLVFQMFTHPGSTVSVGGNASPGPILAPPPGLASISAFAQNLIDRIGSKGSEGRKLGFAIGPVNFDMSDADIRRLIADSFAVAKQKDLAVAVHIDDSMFWLTRRELWSDPRNVEWLDYRGTPNTGRQIDWGQPAKLAPQMCFNSPRIRQEVARLAGVIGRAVSLEVSALENAGRGHLFAGVLAGWEAQIGQDYETKGRLGYCALTNRGFTEARQPVDPDREREKVVTEFLEHWADSLVAGGIVRGKIYSHTAALSKRVYDASVAMNPGANVPSYSAVQGFAPPSASFSPKFNPGFSTYPQEGLLEQLHDEIRARKPGARWASAEGTNLILGQRDAGGQSMETYLAKLFNHGAGLVTIFAWGMSGGDPNYPFYNATEGEESIRAYKAFLNGEALEE